MSKKRTVADDSARARAKQMREAQERADRRTRLIIISVVTVLVVAIAATVGITIYRQSQESTDTSALGAYADGTGVLVSANGIGVPSEADESVPTLTEYFDYTCHACADNDVAIGERLTDAAQSGEINIIYQPVTSVGMAFQEPATAAALVVASQDPDHFVDLHHALLSYFSEQYNAGDSSVIQDTDASTEQVATIAREVGVSEEVIAQFDVPGISSYLDTSTTGWSEAEVEGRDSLATPEYVSNGIYIERSGSTNDEIFESVISGIESANPGSSIER